MRAGGASAPSCRILVLISYERKGGMDERREGARKGGRERREVEREMVAQKK